MGKKIVVVMLACALLVTAFNLSYSFDFFDSAETLLKPVTLLGDGAMKTISFFLPGEKREDPYNTEFYVPSSSNDVIHMHRIYFGDNREYYVDLNLLEGKLRPFKRDWYVLYTNYTGLWSFEEYILPSDFTLYYDYVTLDYNDPDYESPKGRVFKTFMFSFNINVGDFRGIKTTYAEYLTEYCANTMTYEQFQQRLDEIYQ